MCKWLFALLCISISFAECQTVKFTIFSFNDVYEVSPNKDGVGGIAEITTLLEQERAKAERHVTTMNGDFLSPSLLSVFDKGKAYHRTFQRDEYRSALHRQSRIRFRP